MPLQVGSGFFGWTGTERAGPRERTRAGSGGKIPAAGSVEIIQPTVDGEAPGIIF